MEYKVKKLIDAKYDFSQVKPEKQTLLKEKEGYNFNLADVVELLRSETNQFTIKNPVAQALDTEIYAMVCEFHRGRGEDLDICKFDEVIEVAPIPVPAEPEPEPKEELAIDEEEAMKSEWKDALDGLKELLDMGEDAGSKEEIAEWKEAVEGLQELLS